MAVDRAAGHEIVEVLKGLVKGKVESNPGHNINLSDDLKRASDMALEEGEFLAAVEGQGVRSVEDGDALLEPRKFPVSFKLRKGWE